MKYVTIVTGASKGIGLALVKDLLEKGHIVVGTSRSGNIEELDDSKFIAKTLDLSDPSSISEFVVEVKKLDSEPNLLINNAGVGPDLDTDRPNQETFNITFDVNVKGTVFLTEQLAELMPTGSKIINISSIMGSVENTDSYDSVAYRMSKSALNMYSKILSNRYEGKIDVANVHPGWVRTDITPSAKKHGRLTPNESASNIINYLENHFKNGAYWDAEKAEPIKW